MATAYISYCRPLNQDTVTSLLLACRTLVSENDCGKPKWDTIHLSLACGGGNIIAGFAAYNELRGLPIKLITHNVSAVDSAAIMIFTAGSERFATPTSAFLFHQTAWTFSSNVDLPLAVVSNALNWLTEYERLMREVISAGTNISDAEVARLMREGAIIKSADAKMHRLVHDIREVNFPQDARSWQV